MLCVNARFLTQRITGAQRYCLEISKHLAQLEPAARFVAPRQVLHEDAAHALRVERIGTRAGVPWEQIDLPRWLRKQGSPLLVNMQFTAPLGYPRTIITVHDVVFLHRAWVSRQFHWWYRYLIPRLCRTAARVVTVSEFSKREIVARLGVPAAKITVIPGAVAPDFAAQATGSPRAQYGNYVLGVASLNARKNFTGLVRAFARVAHPDLKLVIAGGLDAKIYGNDSALDALLRHERVVMAGYVTDAELAALYRDALAFVFPSLYEGFGIPPLEAMACGCPVIVANTSSLPEVCGDAARYVDPNDELALAGAIEALVGDEPSRRELAARGSERVQGFAWRRSAEQFLDLIRQVRSEATHSGAR